MPIPPSTYAGSAPITAGQLDTDLYTYTPGNFHTPNGILFHANRPLLVEGLTTPTMKQASSSAGSFTDMANTVTANAWKNYADNAVLFGFGEDLPNSVATGRLLATVPGSAGAAGSAGGYFLMWGLPVIGATTNAGGFGAALNEAGGGTVTGGHQLSSTSRDNAAFALDLVPASTTAYSSPVGVCNDASGSSYSFVNQTGDYSGELCRWYGLWAGVVTGGGTVSTVPTPQTAFAGTTAVTSTLLNGLSGLGGALNVLNNPPMLRAANLNGGTISTGTVATVPLAGNTSGTQVDSYSGLNTGTSTYTVPLAGLYLVHGFVNWSANTGGQRQAGLQVNSTNLWGPSYSAAGTGGTSPQVTRILDLHAGDTVKLITQQNSGGSLALIGGQPCRLVVVWLGALWAGGTALAWTPPATGFRWQAGTPGADLPALWQAHMAGDLNFLINRPYLLSYQSSAQSGLAYNSFDTITMNNLTGRVHATPGDNYGGWTSGGSNLYTAQAAGWYLVCAGYFSTAIGGTFHPVAAIAQTPAGYNSPDWYQHVRSVSTSLIPGAEALGLYYLREGDTVQPVYAVQDGTGTMTTSVGTGTESHFEAVWVSN